MFFLSWRQLASRKRQTLLILLGISLATMLYVSISGVQLGMRSYIFEQLLNNTAHVLISGAEREISEPEMRNTFYPGSDVRWIVPPMGKRAETRLQNYGGWYARLQRDPDVLEFAPRLTANALLTSGKFTASVGLIGTLPDRQSRISSTEKYMRSGSFAALEIGGNNIVLASGVAKKLGARLGEIVGVTSGRGASRPFKVVGVIHYGNEQFDDTVAFAHLSNVQAVSGTPGRVTHIAVALFDPDRAGEIADSWQLASHDKVEDWQEANRIFMEMINVQDFTRYFITISILIVAAFGIYNVLTIMISQKKREIAILRAIGYGPGRILELILYQGVMLGLVGGAIGLVLGYGVCVWIASVDFGFEIGGSNHLIVSFSPSIYVVAYLTASASSVLASLLPALGASRMTPMDIIRSEA